MRFRMNTKKVSILCFSQTGFDTGKRLAAELKKSRREVLLEGKSKYIEDSITESHTQWTGRQFETADAVIFIGACGIAVRSIAPFIRSKKKDPAVLVIDECGKFVIALLSGHLGGANELAAEAAEILNAVPVITTATDLHGRFAADVFAKTYNCAIFPMAAAKEVSAALLAGETVGFYSDVPFDGEVPEGVVICDRDGTVRGKMDSETVQTGIAVSIYRDCSPFPVTVHLVPGIVSLGMGCRRGKDSESIRQAAESCLMENQICREALCSLASIDLKKDEAGLQELADKWGIPFVTFDAEALGKAPGEFSPSAFVESVTGVSNVCERSAVCAADGGTLIQKKKGSGGVTTALAVRDWRIRFE